MRLFLTLLLVYIAIAQQPEPFPSCLNDCSGHGACTVSGTCVCTSGWTGRDCSIQLDTLQSGVEVEDEVGAWRWHYYVIANNVPSGSIKIDIKPRGSGFSGDCDIFVRKNEIPTSFVWDYSDVDWGTEATITIENAEATRYYIGVFSNFFRCPYSLKATLNGNCPNGCVHGTCASADTCQCDIGWGGADCSQSIAILSLGQVTSGNVDHEAWTYYEIDLSGTIPKLEVRVNITNEPIIDHDCDLYMKYNQIPTLTSWDYQDVSISSFIYMSMPNPQQGKWYIGFWGFKQCNFNILVTTTTNVCISRCSNHGTCGPPCLCQTPYSGNYCENRTTPLATNEIVSGYVDLNTWNYYTYNTDFSQNNVIITIQQSEAVAGDCDLFVKVGSPPTRWSFDYFEISSVNQFDLVITDVVFSVLYIGIYGFREVGYNMTIHFNKSCIPPCVNGICDNGICSCNSGWSGPACDSQLPTLQSGIVVTGTLNISNEWIYYHYTSTSTTVVVSLYEEGPQNSEAGFLYLLVAEKEEPTLRRYDYWDADLNKGFHTIMMNLDNRAGETIDWVIGVYHVFPNPVTFKLVVWEPK